MLPKSIKLIVHNDQGPLTKDELVINKSIKALKFAISSELNDYTELVKKENDPVNLDLVRSIAELQCALDIIEGAKTKEQKIRIFELIRCLSNS